MLIGAMNNPMKDVVEEIEGFASDGFDFIDLTLEPDLAYSANIPVKKIKQVLEKTGLGVVGHTAYYLPIASPFPELREAAIAEMERSMHIFAEIGAKKVNVHPFVTVPLHDNRWIRETNINAFIRLSKLARKLNLKLMIENTVPLFNTPRDLSAVFSAVPDIGLHLDVGHANLMTEHNLTLELATLFCDRLEHVHFSDNKGGELDLHLPLGVGHIDWNWIVHILKRVGYDGTITLEIFSDDRDYLLFSRDKLRRLWETTKV
ncbi:MAG: sugar phosphate isomerase/epimerase family protein [Armatimonadota bacterium]|nr:sugar phosphate isomerase/epimerase family protein [Armatimonadota bacterium]